MFDAHVVATVVEEGEDPWSTATTPALSRELGETVPRREHVVAQFLGAVEDVAGSDQDRVAVQDDEREAGRVVVDHVQPLRVVERGVVGKTQFSRPGETDDVDLVGVHRRPR